MNCTEGRRAKSKLLCFDAWIKLTYFFLFGFMVKQLCALKCNYDLFGIYLLDFHFQLSFYFQENIS